MAKQDDEKQPIIIIKKVKKVAGGHHGGAWKVAYADFVTAMMAFFLLLWLLNVTTAQQKDMISSYFAPTDPRVSKSESGAGGVMGGTTISPQGSMSSARSALTSSSGEGESEEDAGEETQFGGAAQTEEEKAAAELDGRDEKAFQQAEEQLKQAIESVPELKEVAQNLLVDMTPEGLRIQIVDQEGKPMFASGSIKPLPPAEKLLRLVGQTIRDMPNQISIRGHTDSKPYGKDASYTNWELSTDRANASRRVMLDNGVPVNRIENVQGKAEREPLLPTDPESPRNRRISIILMKQSLAPGVKKPPADKYKPVTPASSGSKPKAEPKKREEGVIYFP